MSEAETEIVRLLLEEDGAVRFGANTACQIYTQIKKMLTLGGTPVIP